MNIPVNDGLKTPDGFVWNTPNVLTLGLCAHLSMWRTLSEVVWCDWFESWGVLIWPPVLCKTRRKSYETKHLNSIKKHTYHVSSAHPQIYCGSSNNMLQNVLWLQQYHHNQFLFSIYRNVCTHIFYFDQVSLIDLEKILSKKCRWWFFSILDQIQKLNV